METTKHVFKVPCVCNVWKVLTSEHGPIVSHEGVRNTICWDVLFQLWNYCGAFHIREVVQLKPARSPQTPNTFWHAVQLCQVLWMNTVGLPFYGGAAVPLVLWKLSSDCVSWSEHISFLSKMLELFRNMFVSFLVCFTIHLFVYWFIFYREMIKSGMKTPSLR